MGKARGGPTRTHVSVRLANTEIDRVDALIARCSTRWHQATRSDVLRLLLIQGLESAERGELFFAAALPLSKDADST
jgi:hypothetical protein